MPRPYLLCRSVLVFQHALQARLEIVRVDPLAWGDGRSRRADWEAVLDDRLAPRERTQRDLVTGGDVPGEHDALALDHQFVTCDERLNRHRDVVHRVDFDGPGWHGHLVKCR